MHGVRQANESLISGLHKNLFLFSEKNIPFNFLTNSTRILFADNKKENQKQIIKLFYPVQLQWNKKVFFLNDIFS